MRGDSAYKWKTRRRRLKAKPGAALNTPAGMRSVCPKLLGALAHEMGGPCPPLPHPPVPVGRGPLGGPQNQRDRTKVRARARAETGTRARQEPAGAGARR